MGKEQVIPLDMKVCICHFADTPFYINGSEVNAHSQMFNAVHNVGLP